MMERGRYARQVLVDYKMAKEIGDTDSMAALGARFEDSDFTDNYFRYFGYSYFTHPWQVIPSVPVTFYSFRVMVGLGFFFIAALCPGPSGSIAGRHLRNTAGSCGWPSSQYLWHTLPVSLGG